MMPTNKVWKKKTGREKNTGGGAGERTAAAGQPGRVRRSPPYCRRRGKFDKRVIGLPEREPGGKVKQLQPLGGSHAEMDPGKDRLKMTSPQKVQKLCGTS